MKTVYVRNGVVREVIPEYALPVADFYGADFASHCAEAPDEVDQGWTYDGTTFSAPAPPAPAQPTADEDRDAMLVDLDYRLTLLELGVN